MTKPRVKLDMENPFIPSRNSICRVADTALVFGVTVAGFAALIAAIYRQLQGAV